MKVNAYKICSGGPTINYYKSVTSECAYRDGSNWRQKNCSIILDKGSICTKCVDLHRLLSRSVDKQKSVKQRIRLVMSPSSSDKKTKLQAIRRRGQGYQKRLHRTQKLLRKLKKELEHCAEKMKSLEKDKVLDAIDKLKLPEKQAKLMN